MSELLKNISKDSMQSTESAAKENETKKEVSDFFPSLFPKSGCLSVADKSIAVSLAIIADFVLEIVPSPWGQILDIVTGLVLFWRTGANWWLLPAFVIEMIPGLGCFPTWFAVTGFICLKGNRK